MKEEPHAAGPNNGPAGGADRDRSKKMTKSSNGSDEPKDNGVVIRDRRKVDVTSAVACPVDSTPLKSDATHDGSDSIDPETTDHTPVMATEDSAETMEDNRASSPTKATVVEPPAATIRATAKVVYPPDSQKEGSDTPEDVGSTAGQDQTVVEGEIVEAPSQESVPDISQTATEVVESPEEKKYQESLAELAAVKTQLEERTADLLRITADYANYRKRVDRDRKVSAEQATATVIGALLPILDDLDRARDHGDLVEPFASVIDQLVATLTKFGLVGFGVKGETFDPNRHEAVAHSTSSEVTESTCVDVLRRGYLLGERLLRPAMVAVADPD